MATKTKSNHTPPVTTLAIQTAATREITPGVKQMLWEMAPHMHKAHLFGVTSPEQAYAIMTKGYEVGLSATASFEFIHVIDGKPGLSPRGAMALLVNSPLVAKIKVTRLVDSKGNFVGYECYMKRKNIDFEGTERFTLEDATRAGLMKPNSGWTKYPENMCKWRAIGFAADAVFPDVLAGMSSMMKAPEMYGVALTEGGDVVDVIPVSVPSVESEWSELVNKHATEILQIYGNDIPDPKTFEEIAEVRKKLEGNTE